MDPLSVAAAAIALCGTAYEISHTLRSFAGKVKDADGNLKNFAFEVASTSRILKALTTTLNDPYLHLEAISKGPAANLDVWEALNGTMSDLSLYLQKVRAKLEDVGTESEDGNIFKQALKAFELSSAEDNINNLRSHLMSHQLSLQTVVLMLQLYTQAHRPAAQQPDLRPGISQLIRTVKKLPENDHTDEQTTTIDNTTSGQSQFHRSSITRIRTVAIRIASEASIHAGPPSEHENSLSSPIATDYIHKIEDWLKRSNSDKEKEVSLTNPFNNEESLNHLHDDSLSNAVTVSSTNFDNSTSKLSFESSNQAALPLILSGDDSSDKIAIEQENINNINSETPLVTVSQAETITPPSTPPLTPFRSTWKPVAPQTTAISVPNGLPSKKLRKTVSFSLHSIFPSSRDSFDPPEPIKRTILSHESNRRLFTKLKYVVRGLLTFQLLSCIIELALWDRDFTDQHFPSGALLPIIMAFLTMVYVIARLVVAFRRTETQKTLYARRLLWWHIVPQGLLL